VRLGGDAWPIKQVEIGLGRNRFKSAVDYGKNEGFLVGNEIDQMRMGMMM
jgi:hypothetical protein